MNQRPYYLKPKRVFTEKSIQNDVYVLVENGTFREITSVPKPGIDTIYTDKSMLPGFLDLHIHGREGCDVMDATRESIETISLSLAKHGVVGFLATTVTSTWENTLNAFRTIGEAYHNQPSGALVLGAYNEGIFFTEDHKGAHDEKYFLSLNKNNIDAIINAAQGSLKVVALAPELKNSQAIIQHLALHKIKPMLGHTNANFKQTSEALKHGACGGVHVFNGMRGIHHRDPGCAGAVLLDQEAYVELIADGVHLHPAILDMVCRLKHSDKVGLISDCIVAGGMPDGEYQLGMLDVQVEQGIARTNSGSLAGSTLTLDNAVNNMIQLAGINPVQAVNMASLSPAKFLELDKEIGSIAVGKKAHFSLCDDEFNVKETYIDGKAIYKLNH